MSQMILIVEDQPKLSSLLQDYLEQSSFRTHIIDNGLDVADWVKTNLPALVLLDLMLPGIDGLEVCKELRSFSDLPIIMITAKVEEIDRLIGLEIGADDYICKPFSTREVVARVKTVLRRMHPKTSNEEGKGLTALVLDKDSYSVKLGSQSLDLTKVEFELLNVMLESPGRIFSRDQLIDRIYSDHRVVSDRTIDSHIKKLRKKLDTLRDDKGNCKEWIISIYSIGYKVELD
jgi:two-component system response regulator BaeR